LRKKRLRIRKARCAGFCFGVRRAIGIAEDFLKQGKPTYSLGAIIHNPTVVKQLSDKGLKVISDIRQAKGEFVVIPSHGISPRLCKKAREFSIGMIDATCPFVKRSHSIVGLLKKEGYRIIVAGERDHPEIKALYEVAGPGTLVVAKSSALKHVRAKKVAVVAQTTLSREVFLEIASSVLNMNYLECRIFDTICNDVVKRQLEATQLSRTVDLMLVVGGRMSANTRHLAEICKKISVRTHHIETERELKKPWFRGVGCVGVISGASTPEEIVDRVVMRLKSFKKK